MQIPEPHIGTGAVAPIRSKGVARRTPAKTTGCNRCDPRKLPGNSQVHLFRRPEPMPADRFATISMGWPAPVDPVVKKATILRSHPPDVSGHADESADQPPPDDSQSGEATLASVAELDLPPDQEHPVPLEEAVDADLESVYDPPAAANSEYRAAAGTSTVGAASTSAAAIINAPASSSALTGTRAPVSSSSATDTNAPASSSSATDTNAPASNIAATHASTGPTGSRLTRPHVRIIQQVGTVIRYH